MADDGKGKGQGGAGGDQNTPFLGKYKSKEEAEKGVAEQDKMIKQLQQQMTNANKTIQAFSAAMEAGDKTKKTQTTPTEQFNVIDNPEGLEEYLKKRDAANEKALLEKIGKAYSQDKSQEALRTQFYKKNEDLNTEEAAPIVSYFGYIIDQQMPNATIEEKYEEVAKQARASIAKLANKGGSAQGEGQGGGGQKFPGVEGAGGLTEGAGKGGAGGGKGPEGTQEDNKAVYDEQLNERMEQYSQTIGPALAGEEKK